MSSLLKTFQKIPKELFRLNNGAGIRLRDKNVKRIGSFDLLTEAGKVLPKALSPHTYTAPNGASMRPNTPTQNRLVRDYKGSEVVVYAVPAGTQLPDELILVHERDDHYSLQAAKEMTLDELNSTITEFLQAHATALSKEQWLAKYPQPTETS